MAGSWKFTEEELRAVAARYYGHRYTGVLFVDLDVQVVHRPCDDRGTTAVQIVATEEGNATWQEGWYSPTQPFRTFS